MDEFLPIISIEGGGSDEIYYEAVTFTLRLSEVPLDAVSVNYMIRLYGSASDRDVDNHIQRGTLTFAPGQTTITLSVPIEDDSLDERDESFFLELRNPQGATFGGGNATLSATGWIFDNDGLGLNTAIAIANPIVSEDAGIATFTVSLSRPMSENTTFSYHTYDLSAKAGSDYTAKTGTISFAAGQTQATIEVPITNDNAIETNETFGLRVAGVGSIPAATATATILDNDAALPTLSVQSYTRATELYYVGVTFVLTLSEPSESAVNVNWRLRFNGTAESADADYGSSSNGTATFLPGQTQIELYFGIEADGLDELDEYLSLELTDPVGASFGPNIGALDTIAWIMDDDGANPNRAIAISNPVVSESASSVNFHISLSQAYTTETSFTYSTFNLTAVAGSDYTAKTGTVTFAAGQTEAVIAVALTGDSMAETNESFGIRISPLGSVPGVMGIATILDNDAALPVASIEGSDSTEAYYDYSHFIVRLSKPAVDSVTIDWRVKTTGSAGDRDLDYPSQSGKLTFLPGETVKDIYIGMESDSDDELDENYFVELTNPQGVTFAGGYNAIEAMGWILDDDGPRLNRTIAVSNPLISERNPDGVSYADFTIELSRPVNSETTVQYKTVNGSAAAGSDYRAVSGELVFAAGQTRAVVRVEIMSDVTREAAETFSLQISGYSNTVAISTGTPFGTATILDGSLIGTAHNDRLEGTARADRLEGIGGNDTLLGMAGNDYLFGGTGNDWLDGGIGADRMDGGSGNDTYVVNSTGDIVVEAASGGSDLVRSSISYTLGANVERLLLTGTAALQGSGNSLSNVLTGNNAANRLYGGAGNDTLYGGFGADSLYGGSGNDTLDGGGGADSMAGGSGNDTYIVNHATDIVVEAANAGTDTVITTASFALGANLENLILSGTAALRGTGNSLSNRITGNAAANILTGAAGNDNLTGGSGNDTLYGGSGNDVLDGGLGIDRMDGGTGNDTYYVNHTSDAVIEAANAGIDTVRSSVTLSLAANVENLILTGTLGTAGTGNSLANKITGNAAANKLYGGSGDDSLYGGAGQDSLYGGIGDDLLDGGAGPDRMEGGSGNDIYVVNHSGDTVVEGANGGTDTVKSAVTYRLGANVENLQLLGTGALIGTGNSLSNIITGNAGNNQLFGGAGNDTLQGGTGIDRLSGGTGRDVFVFSSVSEAGLGTRRDMILDFERNQDRIDLRQIDANTSAAGDQAFRWIGSAVFSGIAGELRYANSVVQGDINGDGKADFEIHIVNAAALLSVDFLL